MTESTWPNEYDTNLVNMNKKLTTMNINKLNMTEKNILIYIMTMTNLKSVNLLSSRKCKRQMKSTFIVSAYLFRWLGREEVEWSNNVRWLFL